jgi:hypothetical protein
MLFYFINKVIQVNAALYAFANDLALPLAIRNALWVAPNIKKDWLNNFKVVGIKTPHLKYC